MTGMDLSQLLCNVLIHHNFSYLYINYEKKTIFSIPIFITNIRNLILSEILINITLVSIQVSIIDFN